MPSVHITWSLLHAPAHTAAMAFLGGVLCLASVTDLRQRRIPNLLTFPAALCGMVLHGLTFGWTGLLSSVVAAVAWLTGGILFWSMSGGKGIGAGDVKLATAIAALLGFWPAFFAIFLSNLSQVAYLFLRWIVQGTLYRNLAAMARWIVSIFAPGAQIVHFVPVGMEDKTPHAPFLLIGTVLTIVLEMNGALPW